MLSYLCNKMSPRKVWKRKYTKILIMCISSYQDLGCGNVLSCVRMTKKGRFQKNMQ